MTAEWPSWVDTAASTDGGTGQSLISPPLKSRRGHRSSSVVTWDYSKEPGHLETCDARWDFSEAVTPLTLFSISRSRVYSEGFAEWKKCPILTRMVLWCLAYFENYSVETHSRHFDWEKIGEFMMPDGSFAWSRFIPQISLVKNPLKEFFFCFFLSKQEASSNLWDDDWTSSFSFKADQADFFFTGVFFFIGGYNLGFPINRGSCSVELKPLILFCVN